MPSQSLSSRSATRLGAAESSPGAGSLAAVWRVLAAAVALAALSLLLVAPAPSYDPWMWLLWGREVSEGALDTREGPAFKPLPVAVTALLASLGGAAPTAWVLLVRAAAVVAAVLAWRLGREFGGGPWREDGGAPREGDRARGARAQGGLAGAWLGGALAVAAVLLCGRFLALSAAGAETALVVAGALGGVAAWRAGRLGIALACAVACALLRVEAWPFLLAAGAVLWRRAPAFRPALALLAVVVPAAWLAPEWLGSGDPLRSGARARVPNPGQPALADVPFLASLRGALTLPPWPLWLGVAALAVGVRRGRDRGVAHGDHRAMPAAGRGRDRGGDRPALALAGLGLAWMLLVAAMAQAGFSGEARYALPGATLVGVAGAAGLARAVTSGSRRTRTIALTAAALLAVPAAIRIGDLPELRSLQAYQQRLGDDLAGAVAATGGRDAVLRCGRPYVGPLRGPLLAYRLDVVKAAVEPDEPPRPSGVAFRSALVPGAPVRPDVPPSFTAVARVGYWDVRATCPLRRP